MCKLEKLLIASTFGNEDPNTCLLKFRENPRQSCNNQDKRGTWGAWNNGDTQSLDDQCSVVGSSLEWMKISRDKWKPP